MFANGDCHWPTEAIDGKRFWRIIFIWTTISEHSFYRAFSCIPFTHAPSNSAKLSSQWEKRDWTRNSDIFVGSVLRIRLLCEVDRWRTHEATRCSTGIALYYVPFMEIYSPSSIPFFRGLKLKDHQWRNPDSRIATLPSTFHSNLILISIIINHTCSILTPREYRVN